MSGGAAPDGLGSSDANGDSPWGLGLLDARRGTSMIGLPGCQVGQPPVGWAP